MNAIVQLDPSIVLDLTSTPPMLRSGQPTGVQALLPIQVRETPQGKQDGVNPVFTLSATPLQAYPVLIFLNGVLLTESPIGMGFPANGDYQIAQGKILFMNGTQTASKTSRVPTAADQVSVVYWHSA